jgi:hypothetical protein
MAYALVTEPGGDSSWLSIILVPLLFLLSNAYFLAIVGVIIFLASYGVGYCTRGARNSHILRSALVILVILMIGVYMKSRYEDFVLSALIGPLCIAVASASPTLASRFKL